MRVLGASIIYAQTGLSYMKEVQASNGQVRISSPPGAVGCSGPAQAARSPDAPARASSYAPWWRGSRLDRPSSRGRSRRFQARSSPDSPASVQAQWQRCADVVTHPPTDATVPRAPRLPSWPGGTVLRRDRKSTRLNSSHLVISYAVFCLKKKKPIVAISVNIISLHEASLQQQ